MKTVQMILIPCAMATLLLLGAQATGADEEIHKLVIQVSTDDESTQQDQANANCGLDRVVAKLVVEGYEKGEKGKDRRASLPYLSGLQSQL